MKTMFRMYPETQEVVALMPEVSGDPQGSMSVAFAAAGGWYSADPEKVIGNTEPAPEAKFKRLKRQIEKVMKESKIAGKLEVIDECPPGAASSRAAEPEAYRQFGRIARLHAHRQ